MPEDLKNEIIAWISIMIAAVAGRLMYHAYQVQRGKRKFWSAALALDLVIAFGMGMIAHGACAYLGISGAIEMGVVSTAGYFGPHGLDALFDWKFGDSKKRKSDV